MIARVGRSRACGGAQVPGSKSYTIRAAMCAAMAAGESILEGALESDDASAIFECLHGLGATVSRVDGSVLLCGGGLQPPSVPLNCRESGATLRFLAALAATVPGVTILQCAPPLARRPHEPLLAAIRQLGVRCEFDVRSGRLVVYGRQQPSARVTLRGDVSSQFLSALLLSGPRYGEGLEIRLLSPVVSQRYVEMTCECMRRFGVSVEHTSDWLCWRVPPGLYSPRRYEVEGDWSAAAALLALGAMTGDVQVRDLSSDSLQADVAMLDLLAAMGAIARADGHSVRVTQSALRGCSYNLAQCIDLLPAACVLAAMADGETELSGIARARDKESDRVQAMATGLGCLGVPVDVSEDTMRVRGGSVRAGEVLSAGDHRIAMAFGVLGAATGGVVVHGAECVSKTYPAFWQVLCSLGVEVTCDE